MEMTLNLNEALFAPLTFDELMVTDGGNVVDVLKATAGAVLIAWTPVIAIATGVVATPIMGVCAGMSVLGLGMMLLGSACH